MSWADFSALLAEAALQPSFVLIGVLCVLVAGTLAVLAVRGAQVDEEPDDASDTQADWPKP